MGISYGTDKRTRRSRVRPRVPLAYAGLLIIALVAVIGFAAFSPSSDEAADVIPLEDQAEPEASTASARVASAVLALRVSDAESRTATTTAGETSASTTSSSTTTTEDVAVESLAADTTSSEAPSTTEAPTTTAAPRDTTAPSLSITSHDDGDTVTDRIVTFRGTSEKGASVFSGPYDADVDSDGDWSLRLVMTSGANGAQFTARDGAGNETTKRIVVYYEPPSATTTTQPTTTTTSGSSSPKWSPLWPADAGGRRNVEAWRPLVAQYWPADLVDCALNIIQAESEGDPRAYNSRTKAEGLFQHLSKYWKGRAAAAGFRDSNGLYASPYNAEANIAAAWLIASGSNPWHRPWTVNPYHGNCQP